MEYFPKLTRLGQEGDFTKYGAECHFGGKIFYLIMTTKAPNKIAIQGLANGECKLMEFAMSYLQHLFTLGE